MKYNKINELLVKEAFKPSKHNYGYQVDAEHTFLCIDGALGLRLTNVEMYVDVARIFWRTKPFEKRFVDRLFEGASSADLLTATTELFQNGKMVCNVYTLPDGQKVYINRDLLKYFDDPILYTTGIKKAVYVKEKDFDDVCAVVMPVNNY